MIKKNAWLIRAGLFIFSGIILCYVVAIALKNVYRYNKFKHEHVRIQDQYSKSKSINEKYRQKMIEMETKSYWELEARRRLGFVKKDETVYKFVYEFQKWR